MYAGADILMKDVTRKRKIFPRGKYCGKIGEIWVGTLTKTTTVSWAPSKTKTIFEGRYQLKPKTLVAVVMSKRKDLIGRLYFSAKEIPFMIAFDGDRVGCAGCFSEKFCQECQKTAIGLRAIQMYKSGVDLDKKPAQKKGAKKRVRKVADKR